MNFFAKALGILPGFGKFWIEITTTEPACTYYFGPFDSEQEAAGNKSSYLSDLEAEGAKGIQVNISQRRQPEQLTVERPQTRV
ncbi:MAG: DUF1816 domain-containing protein [Cyanophyceae cyanobacterium]